MAQIYKIFAEGWTGLDFSDSSLIEMYNSESYGEPIDERKNGFYVGKHWMDVTISMWKEDRASGHLVLSELYNDPRFPSDWLDAVLR
jgi:hypothetical protein